MSLEPVDRTTAAIEILAAAGRDEAELADRIVAFIDAESAELPESLDGQQRDRAARCVAMQDLALVAYGIIATRVDPTVFFANISGTVEFADLVRRIVD